MFPVDAFRATVSRFVSILDQHAVRFHLTGGITSVAWGEPRMTQDIDLVVDNQALAERLAPFLASLAASVFMFDAASIRHALQQRGMFQVLDTEESLKLDVYVREMIPGELGRSVRIEVFHGLVLPIASRADAAASKLVWISKGSHKSRRDLRKICAAAPPGDLQLLRKLAAQLGLESLLANVLKEPDEIEDALDSPDNA
jgi:hypothetical protein